ncbi:hypothetical protein CLV86_1152 [Lacinutrix venerupis]|nr:hypothetical protein CLV86_1152 [Lacinutrix venerupis]
MKNIKRLFLLVALIILTVKVFSSEFSKITKHKTSTLLVLNN